MCNPGCMTEQHEMTGGVPVWDQPDRMRKSLRHSGVGVAEIADYLGVSRTAVSTWINGRIQPSTQTLRLWALRTGVPYEWLRDGDAPGGQGPDDGCPRQDSNLRPKRYQSLRSLRMFAGSPALVAA